MNFCYRCGAEVENEKQKFCINCGANLIERKEKEIDDSNQMGSDLYEDYISSLNGLDDSSKVSKIMEDYEELIEVGLYDKALNLIDYALKIDPDNDDVLNDKAVVYSNLDEDDKSLLYYKKSLEVNPNNSQT